MSTKRPSGGTPRGTACPPRPCSPWPGPPPSPAHRTDCSVSSCYSRPRLPSLEAPPSTGSCPMARGEAAPLLRDGPCRTLGLELDITGGTFLFGLFLSPLVLHQLADGAVGQAPDAVVLGICPTPRPVVLLVPCRSYPRPTHQRHAFPSPGPPGHLAPSIVLGKTPEKGFFMSL